MARVKKPDLFISFSLRKYTLSIRQPSANLLQPSDINFWTNYVVLPRHVYGARYNSSKLPQFRHYRHIRATAGALSQNKIIILIKISSRKFTSTTSGTKSVNGRHYHTIKSICDRAGLLTKIMIGATRNLDKPEILQWLVVFDQGAGVFKGFIGFTQVHVNTAFEMNFSLHKQILFVRRA